MPKDKIQEGSPEKSLGFKRERELLEMLLMELVLAEYSKRGHQGTTRTSILQVRRSRKGVIAEKKVFSIPIS